MVKGGQIATVGEATEELVNHYNNTWLPWEMDEVCQIYMRGLMKYE